MTIEAFKPIADCSGSELYDGIAQGIWLAKSLFIALGKTDDQQDEQSALSFLGASILAEIEAKQKALADRSPPRD